MKKFLGGDIGGSKADLVLLDEAGEIIKFVQAEGINFQIGRERFIENLKELLYRHNFPDFERGVVGVAGIYRKEEKSELESQFPRIKFLSDVEILLHGEFSEEPGMVVIAGTGSIIAVKDSAGNIRRFGGYGYLLDDVGSGFLIGKRALIAAARSAEKLGPRTTLEEILLQFFEKDNFVDVAPVLYNAPSPQRIIASLTPVVFKEYGRDEVATQIIENSIQELVNMVFSIYKKYEGEVTRCLLSGGLFREKIYSGLFKSFLEEKRCPLKLVFAAKPAALYAAEIAKSGL